MDEDLVELVRFQHVWQAHILSSLLEEELLENFVSELGVLEPITGYVVYVNREDLDEAKQVLKSFDDSESHIIDDIEE